MLDRKHFSTADDPEARNLLEVLLAVFDVEETVKRLVKDAGLRTSDVEWRGPMAEIWPRVLEHAAQAGRLRKLIGVVANEPDSTAYDIFSKLLSQPAVDEAPGHGRGRVRRLLASTRSRVAVSVVCMLLLAGGVVAWERWSGSGNSAGAGSLAGPSRREVARADHTPSLTPTTVSSAPTKGPSPKPSSSGVAPSDALTSGPTSSASPIDVNSPHPTPSSGPSYTPTTSPAAQITGTGPISWASDSPVKSYRTTTDDDADITGQLYSLNQMVNLSCQRKGTPVAVSEGYEGPKVRNDQWFLVASTEHGTEWLSALYVDAQPYPLPSCPSSVG
ncbi:effector-associated domain EAD1-containing protein [Streptomyces sp. NBC_00343]|uniref:effector-associated domain EAD1-containing protein n=1 Tax=Streptomyces sp. NBC_00343 TaxID=2975719 RepID=UPI002E2D8377|nr:effector-associated domain EAD1-containing protein [Streptomyces sp. NBC_00343]